MSFSDAVASFNSEVDAAVSRARRAAAEAREQSGRFRESAPASGEATDPALRAEAVRFRTGQGLPVGDEPVETPPVPQSSDEDEDFSQEQIMHRF
ncbi:hypothetical protein JOF56_002894 [Kibdelosporangium banguiense]|uniref:Uncharacterized protein n=1 Tax=Kibdelosporangium banguiense TaxID=1365924 RepID=A0ABS4TEU3_9PSEU|nr:hypothetical protein [Kibdelosporangium banguiense]MBP2322509.1 hypothetical protein [Kibdelosporangium banguiense]